MTAAALQEVFRAHLASKNLTLADREGRPLDGIVELEALLDLAEVARDAMPPVRWDEEVTREMPAVVLDEALQRMENE